MKAMLKRGSNCHNENTCPLLSPTCIRPAQPAVHCKSRTIDRRHDCEAVPAAAWGELSLMHACASYQTM